jgi:hypothetical protein
MIMAGTIILQDDFETTGNQGPWSTYSCTEETTIKPSGSTRSLLLSSADCLQNTSLSGSFPSGLIQLRMEYYMKTGQGANDPYLKLRNGASNVISIEGGDNGAFTLGFFTGSAWVSPTNTYAKDSWKNISIVYSESGNNCSVRVWNTTIDTTTQISDCTVNDAVINVLTWGSQGTAGTYIDNFVMCDGICPSTSPAVPSGSIVVYLTNPPNNVITPTITRDFSYVPNVTLSNITTCGLYFNGTLNRSNTTTITYNATNTFSSVTLNDGSYLWSVGCYNTTSTIFSATNYSLIIDSAAPTVTNNLVDYYTNIMVLKVNMTDTNPKNLTIRDDCNINYTNTSMTDYFLGLSMTRNISNCSLGLHTTQITAYDTANNSYTNSYNWYNMIGLNITARDALDSSAVTTFMVFINGTNVGNTTNGYVYLTNLTTTDLNVTIDATGYSFFNEIKTINKTYEAYQVTLDKTNALNIVIKDEATGFSITANVTIRFTTSTTEFTNITNTSSFYIYDLEPTEYTITFTANLYNPRTYIVTIGNRTSQSLTAYLASGTDTTLFSISDKDTSAVLSGVTVTMYGFINSTWTPVQISETDITGRTELIFLPYTSYKFYLVKDGYQDYVFYLNPILFDSYNIKMSKINLLNETVDFDGIDVIFNPQIFYNNQLNNFTFIIGSPGGSLISYGMTLTYPTGTDTDTGTNAIGGQLFKSFTITNAGAFDTVTLNYYYETTLAGRRNFTYTFPIIRNGSSNSGTFMANKNKTYGLGIFERILVSTLITLFVVGFAALIGQIIPGIAMGLIITGYMVLIGFIPIWLVLPTMFIGVLFLMKASGGN